MRGEMPMPLEQFRFGQARGVDTARELGARAFRDHRLEPLEGDVCLRINRARLGEAALSAMSFGGAVEIDVGPLEDFYVEHFVTRGRAEIRQDDCVESCTERTGAVMSADRYGMLRLDDDCVLGAVRVERAALEAHLERLTGRRVRSRLVFGSAVDLRRAPGSRRQRLMRLLFEEVECGSAQRDPLPGSGVDEAYLDALLLTQPHSHRHLIERRPRDAGATAVRRVEDYIRAHPERTIRSPALVALSGVSTSSLYDAFLRRRGTSPMRLLREVRLDRVREDLLSARSGETVTQIATRWGFTHLARFSAQYRTRFGELPSETLLEVHSGQGQR